MKICIYTKIKLTFVSEPLLPFYHPQFVGCWWLGYVVMGSLIFLASLPMFFFPKHLEAYYTIYKKSRTQVQSHSTHKSRHTGLGLVAAQLKGCSLYIYTATMYRNSGDDP